MLHIDFTNLKNLQALAKTRDGQHLNLIGNPQFRYGKYWSKSGSQGLEIAEGVVNIVVDGDFNSLDNWDDKGTPATKELVQVNQILNGNSVHVITDGVDEGIQQSLDLTGSTEYTISNYLRANSGTITLGYYDGTSNHETSLPTTDDTWYRVEKTFTTAAVPAGSYFYVLCEDASGEFWSTGFQCEERAYATPFDSVNLDGVTARLDQYLKVPIAGNFPGMTNGTIILSIRPDFDYDSSLAASPVFWSMYDGAGNDWYLIYTIASGHFNFYMDGSSDTDIQSAVQSFSRGDKILLIISWDGNNGDLWVNGVQSVTGTKTQRNVSIPGSMYFGAYGGTLSSLANSVFDEIAILDIQCNQRLADKLQTNFEANKPLIDLLR